LVDFDGSSSTERSSTQSDDYLGEQQSANSMDAAERNALAAKFGLSESVMEAGETYVGGWNGLADEIPAGVSWRVANGGAVGASGGSTGTAGAPPNSEQASNG